MTKKHSIPLDQLKTGTQAVISHFSTGSEKRILKLENFGVTLGTVIRLVQKWPSLVVEIGGTSLALDSGLAHLILVNPEDPDRE